MQTLSTIVQVNPNQSIPGEYLDLLLKSGGGQTIWGAAIVSNGKIIVNRSDKPTDKGINDLLGIFKEKNVTLHFSNMAKPVDDKSRQPFVLRESSDGKPEIVAFVEGDYKSHTVKDGIGSDEYYMVVEFLKPLVEQFAEFPVEQTMGFLTNKMQQRSIAGAAGERGHVVFIANTGQIHSIQNNDQDASFEWGDVSRHHDFGLSEYPTKEPEKEVPADKPLTEEEMMALAMDGTTASVPISDPRIEEKKQLTESILANAKKENLSTTSAQGPAKDYVRLPIPTESNSKRKDFFDKVLHMPRPADWQTLTHVDVPLSKCPPKFLPGPRQDVKGDVETTRVSNAQTATTTNGSVPPITQSVMVPIIPVAQIKAFKETFLNSAEVRAIMATHGGKVPTEQELQDMEKSFPSWSKQTDTPIENTARYSFTADLLLCREYPNLAACLMSTYRNGYFKHFKPQASDTVLRLPQDNQRAIGTGSKRR